MSDLNFSLLPWQQEVFADKTRFKVIAAGMTFLNLENQKPTPTGKHGTSPPKTTP
jgi:hypothetical protein